MVTQSGNLHANLSQPVFPTTLNRKETKNDIT